MLEIPGGPRERGEWIADAARRNLREETGAAQFDLSAVCDYSAEDGGAEQFGTLFYAEVETLGPVPDPEISGIDFSDRQLPNLARPAIQPSLLRKAEERPPRTQAVIFDMDGLMFDTENLYVRKWAEAGHIYGYEIKKETIADCIGLASGLEKDFFLRRFGREFPYAEIRAERDRRVQEYIEKEGVPVKPGLSALLDRLDGKKIKKAVASSTDRAVCEDWLERAGVRKRFDAVICGDMVKRGKPNPDIFLKACSCLNRKAGCCMVLEDSPHGILAAHRAGMKPVMIPDLKKPDAETTSLLFARMDSLADVSEYCLF